MKYLCFTLVLFTVWSCQKNEDQDPLQRILGSEHPAIQSVMDNLDSHEVQIIVTRILDHNDQGINAVTHRFQVDDKAYFYPASTVKFPIAVLALEKVNSLKQVTSQTPYTVLGDSISSTIRDDIKAIFSVSDNASYNRLYEFLGRDYINAKLKQKGLQPARISHRLETKNPLNPKTKPIVFQKENDSVYQLPYQVNSEVQHIALKALQKGIGYYKNDSLIHTPMDFSKKNYLPVSTLHELMKRVQFPESYNENQRFMLNDSDQEFLLDVMQIVPRKAGFDEKEYHDGYVKFLMYGDSKKRIPDHINILNKVGYAYGYLTDCAFIQDHDNGISFIVTATIHVNKNRIFNDDLYEYESIGIPFLAELGRQLHQYYMDSETVEH
ncbi:serine hydrolase [Psychroserpens algicola]|uniref:Class A beta-lactamase-related serine hydrolase n=1 Tax=Psychroserpens algicola TaxID=1719034 RepID=A0ABT0HC05_9FLAO|nr:serine hydrolase [Psychroserpens algicola]MCK8481599.1 class A beta-lactamase-related serine hydrolase [Psychroserpens algicola]